MPDCWNNLYYVFRHNFFLKKKKQIAKVVKDTKF